MVARPACALRPQPYDSSAGWPIIRAISRRHGADAGGCAIYRSSGNRRGAYIAAHRYAQQSSTLAPAIGDQWAQGIALGALALARQALGNQANAERNFGVALLTIIAELLARSHYHRERAVLLLAFVLGHPATPTICTCALPSYRMRWSISSLPKLSRWRRPAHR
jgi:hypothetical protein